MSSASKPPDNCVWQWFAATAQWVQQSFCSAPDHACDPPTSPGTFDGQEESTDCLPLAAP